MKTSTVSKVIKSVAITLALPLAVWVIMEALIYFTQGTHVICTTLDIKNLIRGAGISVAISFALSMNLTISRAKHFIQPGHYISYSGNLKALTAKMQPGLLSCMWRGLQMSNIPDAGVINHSLDAFKKLHCSASSWATWKKMPGRRKRQIRPCSC